MRLDQKKFMSFNPPTQFPEHPYGDLLDKVLLYRHSSDDLLVPIRSEDLIEDGSIIEIILRGMKRERGGGREDLVLL